MKRHNGEYPAPLVAIPGWMDGRDLEWLYQQAKKHKTIVEIGSAYGRSSHALLTGNYEAFGKDGAVYCVDPWYEKNKGIGEFPYRGKDMVRRTQFFFVCGLFPNLRVLEVRSDQARECLRGESVGMVFLDGSIPNMIYDVELWLTKPLDLLCGHDFCCDLQTEVMKKFQIRIEPSQDGSFLWVKK
jgi:hypothetical protein